MPTAAPTGDIAAAQRALTTLGLRTLGGAPGDAFLLGVRPNTGTVEAVSPVSLPGFSYTLPLKDPSVRLHWQGSGPQPLPLDRSDKGFHHLGDLTLRVRPAGSNRGYSTHSTVSRTVPLPSATAEALRMSADGASASIDATPCLTPPVPELKMSRTVEVTGAEARLSVTLTNTRSPQSGPGGALELGGLGFTIPMNQMFSGRSLPQVARSCSFTEVYTGGEAGYVQVTRTTGEGPVLLVMPTAHAPSGAPSPAAGGEKVGGGSGAGDGSKWRGFEGWRPLKGEERANYDWMHEMLYEAVVHSKAYASSEWRGATPWCPPTSAVLQPGESATYGLTLRLAKDVEGVDQALLHAGLPVALPIPGPTLNIDMSRARLVVLTPPSLLLVGRTTEPNGCIDVSLIQMPLPTRTENTHSQTLTLTPRLIGRCRIHLKYKRNPSVVGGDGLTFGGGGGGGDGGSSEVVQYVHMMVLEKAGTLLQRHGDFASNVGWLATNASDPWHRSPGFMGSDAEGGAGRGGALLEEPRVFMAGMSDESGASAPLAMSIKQLGLPSRAEVDKLEEWVHGTLWQGERGERRQFLQGKDHSVRLSMLYWSDDIDAQPTGAAAGFAPALYRHCHKCWATCRKKRDCCYWMHCWSEEHSLETWRAYNYPHVTSDYWALYRLGRHFSPPLTRRATWRWYLEQAGKTALAMHKFGGRGTSQWGLMVGSVFELVLRDLKREGFAALAASLEAMKVKRMTKWLALEFPYGSEFPWDSTGHEEIHTWLLHDARTSLSPALLAAANKTVQAVLAYSSVLPHWAYCGSARRYWDFTINGKTQWGNEREFHHYGSTLNAVAVLDSYRAFPNRFHLLRLGTCALLGHLSNIHPNGAASMAWHGDPGLLRRDAYSGDYGPGLYGYWRSAASYVVCMPPYGWSCFLCDLDDPSAPTPDQPGATDGCDTNVKLRITPRDAFGRRAYLASIGLYITVDGASMTELLFAPSENSVSIVLKPHSLAPSAEATLALAVERIEPPPPGPVSAYTVRCDEPPVEPTADACIRPVAAPSNPAGEFSVKLASDGRPTRITIMRAK